MPKRSKPFGNFKNKFNAVKTTVDNITFHSKKEAKRYSELKILELAGEITNLVLQPRYPCKVKGHVICTYVADFRYDDHKRKAEIVEDVKGMKTPDYKIKKKLVEPLYGITITET